MPLTVKVLSYKGRAPAKPFSASFDRKGGTIGRQKGNNLVLPDPNNYVSRNHAKILYERGCYYIKDTSQDGTSIDNKDLNLQQNTDPVQLNDGDRIRICEYNLIVSIPPSEASEYAPSPIISDEINLDDSKPGMEQPIGINKSLWPENDSFNKDPRSINSIGNHEESPIHESFVPPEIAPPHEQPNKIPEDIDFGEFLNNIDQAGYDDEDSETTDPFALNEGNSQDVQGNLLKRPPGTDDFEPLGVHPTVPVKGEPLADRSTAKPDLPVSKAIRQNRQQAEGELFNVFLEALGVKDTNAVKGEKIPDLLRTTGTVFREMIDGMMKMLRGRTEQKSQARLSVTMLRSSENNPLKFSPNVEDAIKLLLTKNNPGYLDAVEAVREGYSDIMNHQLAMTAGIQASLLKLLGRFDPQHFEKLYENGIIPRKKTKCWDAYSREYRKIVEEVLDNIFGEEFVRTYEQQIHKLRSTPNKR